MSKKEIPITICGTSEATKISHEL